jgi:peptidoglycan/xylan/chitin deacetylase (PgdA/CDA1 family)
LGFGPFGPLIFSKNDHFWSFSLFFLSKKMIVPMASLAAWLPFRTLWRATRMPHLLPFFHFVGDESAPHIRYLYPPCGEARFRADLAWLLRYFEPVSLDDLVAGRPTRRPAMHLSFDDGLRQCHDVVLPILQAEGVPATFFVNPDFVDNQALMFRYKASLLADAVPHLKKKVLRIGYAHGAELDALATQHDVDVDFFLKKYQPYLTHAQVQHLLAAGHSVGAHSLDHPLYADLPLTDQLHQTEASAAAVRARWGVAQPAFAFPFTDAGVGPLFFEKKTATMPTFGCAGLKKEMQVLHFQRLALEKTTRPAATSVPAECVAFLLKKMLGRHVARR